MGLNNIDTGMVCIHSASSEWGIDFIVEGLFDAAWDASTSVVLPAVTTGGQALDLKIVGAVNDHIPRSHSREKTRMAELVHSVVNWSTKELGNEEKEKDYAANVLSISLKTFSDVLRAESEALKVRSLQRIEGLSTLTKSVEHK